MIASGCSTRLADRVALAGKAVQPLRGDLVQREDAVVGSCVAQPRSRSNSRM